MYNLADFKAHDAAEVIAFMKAHPFVVICGADASGKPVATHIPALVKERGDQLFLQAHIMRKQNHTIAFEENQQVLAIFHGAHTYISAQLYEPQNVASTWNYMAVHASGVLRFLGDEALYNLLGELTEHFEQNPHSPALMGKMDEQYIRGLMKAIVAFEIEVTDLQHVFKLSQNKDKALQQKIVQHLQTGDNDDQTTAAAMQQHANYAKK
ncbi:MAG: FMN-binding negative transcriptional regulator [Sphingobacteriia bacterium]|nr:MAG: FMN-binding negative transcriptional regulator [Sphingobacteriia bacterium]TAG30032.1 MAG: FMN-binding negative transcriptional regulator [Sphingobacteriia bacterium]TAH06259.1 MAG: FMN-binding negative transcriptional regulator [Sphingobacteriia bacterium]